MLQYTTKKTNNTHSYTHSHIHSHTHRQTDRHSLTLTDTHTHTNTLNHTLLFLYTILFRLVWLRYEYIMLFVDSNLFQVWSGPIIWFKIFDFRFLILFIFYFSIFDFRFLIFRFFDFWFSIFDFWFLIFDFLIFDFMRKCVNMYRVHDGVAPLSWNILEGSPFVYKACMHLVRAPSCPGLKTSPTWGRTQIRLGLTQIGFGRWPKSNLASDRHYSYRHSNFGGPHSMFYLLTLGISYSEPYVAYRTCSYCSIS